MSLVTQLNTVLTRIGTEFKAIRTVTGVLANLDTTDKDSLVDAINEVYALGAGGGGATNLSTSRNATTVTVASDTGDDAVLVAADASNAGIMTAAQASKLAGIEAAADVTDAANVDAAGAVMLSDTSTTGMGFVVDEDDMVSNSATKVPTQQSVVAYTAAQIATLIDSAPGALDTLNELAAALGNDAAFATTVNTALGNRVRTDTAAQGLNGTQQQNARTNIAVYSTTEIGAVDADFVATFEAALV